MVVGTARSRQGFGSRGRYRAHRMASRSQACFLSLERPVVGIPVYLRRRLNERRSLMRSPGSGFQSDRRTDPATMNVCSAAPFACFQKRRDPSFSRCRFRLLSRRANLIIGSLSARCIERCRSRRCARPAVRGQAASHWLASLGGTPIALVRELAHGHDNCRSLSSLQRVAQARIAKSGPTGTVRTLRSTDHNQRFQPGTRCIARGGFGSGSRRRGRGSLCTRLGFGRTGNNALGREQEQDS